MPRVGEKAGVWVMGLGSNMKAYAPKKQLTALIYNWDDYYIKRVNQVLNGDWSSENTWGGIC